MRIRNCIDQNWKFNLGDEPNATATDFDDSSWRALDLPHDWSIEGTPHPDNPAGAGGGFFPGGIGWYRKKLDIPVDLGDSHVIIEFDGAYMNSEVWCNGQSLGIRPYGYISFAYDITACVRAGEAANIAVRIDNENHKNCRWYSGSGLYRHVWLTIAAPIRVDHWGTYVTTPQVSDDQATVNCEVTIVNDTDTGAEIEVSASVVLDTGEDKRPTSIVQPPTLQRETASTSPLAAAHCSLLTSPFSSQVSGLRFHLPAPLLWSPDSPNLYTLVTELKREGRVIDRYETRFGVRNIVFDANHGFTLNGVPVKLMGVNEHHDAGCLGAAVPDDVIRRRFKILKEMGCNAIRVAHNPASPVFLDLCDEMGLMIVEDAFDEWKDGKTPFGYGLYWDDWWERDLTDMIRRDRNHPSIVMWSVGNEIKEVREGLPEGLPIMEALRAVCHREDETRPMTCGCCSTRKTLAAGYGPIMDVVGYNGGGGSCFDYEKDHAKYPGMVIFASEVPHSLQTRGVYRTRTWYRDLARNPDVERLEVPHLADEEVFTMFDKHYQSSYDNAMVRISAIDSWHLTKTLPFMCGEFRWTGFDYIGECYGWPAKSWNFGVIDLCGFPKDTYYFYQSQWTTKPMVHILPHWTWPGLEGKVIPIVAYSNCDEVELFQDGESLGRQRIDETMYVRWDVKYKPGALRSVGYRDGLRIAECSHETASEPAGIKISCDVSSLRADRSAIAHIEAHIVDAHGRFVPYAANDLTFEVTGPAKLIGVENGDPIDSTNYKLNHRKAFHGMALGIVQSTGEYGSPTVAVRSHGLTSAEITLTTS